MTIRISRRTAISIAGVLAAGSVGLTGCSNNDAAKIDGPATVTSIDGQQISLPAAGEATAVFFFSVAAPACARGP